MQNWLLLLFAVNLFGRLSCVLPHMADDSLTPSVLRNSVLFTCLNIHKLNVYCIILCLSFCCGRDWISYL